MRKFHLATMTLMKFLAVALSLAPLLAQAPNTLTAAEAKAGWKLLFDGKSFAGWRDPAKMNPPGTAWVISDGCLKTVPHAAMREDLLSAGEYGDFELTFEWKISPGGNSGVKYRIQDIALLVVDGRAENKLPFEKQIDYELTHKTNKRNGIAAGQKFESYPVAFEFQTIDDERHPDALSKPVSVSGALYSMIPPSKRMAKPAGEFNQGRIVLRGNHVEHWLNGEKVVDADLNDPRIVQGLAKRWGENSPVYQLLTRQPKKKAPISLQHHVDEAWFRNIKIRPL